MKPFLHLKSVDEIEKIIFSLPMLPCESIPLAKAAGRILAKPFYAPFALPGFRRSTMDGYAVRARDTFGASETSPALLTVEGACQMGKMPELTMQPGYAMPIFTGAPLPEGADAVVMVEHTRKAGNAQIEVTRAVAPGMHIVEADEDAAKGQMLMEAGALLRPQEIGMLAAFGVENIETMRPAKVAIISTGDEIRPISAELRPGQLHDVNSWSIEAVCKNNGAEPVRLGVVADDSTALQDAVRNGCKLADIVAVSGGSSAGMRDHTVEAFMAMENARLLAHGAAISPGKPFILATSSSACLLGLPGHVASALICAHVFLTPLINHLQGLRKPAPKPWFEATLSRSVASAQGRRDYIRCKLVQEGENFTAVPLTSPSAVITGLVQADGLVICPENSEGLVKGQKVRVYSV